MKTRIDIRKAYLANEKAVRNLFAGFFSEPLIDRLCNSLFNGNPPRDLTMIETHLQAQCLLRVLRGEQVTYNGHRDPELAEAAVRERERTTW